ncbi:hypothetical protein GCM10009785_17690 [Brooklawnia cerclae]|uniref:Uncharacterized protein n=1 Tax=Brooklawnia cerclae TaxID=349934 RepID=A0ABX0SKU1_9ACTN|nr:hypothetical protein [Brooklawnia cerclae]
MSSQRRGTTSFSRWSGLATVAFFVALAAIIATIVTRMASNQTQTTPFLPEQGCQVTVDGFTTFLNQEQAANASIIVGESIRRGLPARAATIALVTAYQESDLHNLDYGDRDSIGLFQQRPSQGWGTVEEIMDPWYAAGKFYEALVKVPDWDTGVINDVAQAVQLSGHPDAYAQHETKGRAWASALTGYSPASVSCIDRSETPAAASEITDFLARVYGEAVTWTLDGLTLQLTTPGDPITWSVAHLAMLRGALAGVETVQVADMMWINADGEYTMWQTVEPAVASVVITLRG